MALRRALVAIAVGLATAVAPIVACAQSNSTKPKPVAKPAAKTHASAAAKKVVVPPKVEYVPAEPATEEQIEAAERVYYGVYDCEFKQTISIVKSEKFPAFVDVKHGKASYLMKPVLSSTGAIRLEDIRGETLMVQIASKSMLLNVKTAQRLVDDCVSPRQHELIESARAAKAAAVVAAAASAAAGIPSDEKPPETGLLRSPPVATTPASAPR